MTQLAPSQLLKSSNVIFAGYKVPHPLDPHFTLKLQTDGSVTPQQALQDACQALIALIADLQVKFDKEFEMKSFDSVLGGANMGLGGFGVGYGGAGGAGGWSDSNNRGAGAEYLDFGN